MLTVTCLLVAAEAASAPPAKARPRKCPADEIVIGGHDVGKILTILGAKREAGTSDDRLRAYGSHFDRSDPNKDAKHTRAEYVDGGSFMTPQARAGIFGATDNNADGIVTRVEYVLNRAITDEAKAIVQRTDADKNGKVTRDEFVKGSPVKDKALAGAVYDALDTNSDGVITVPEYLRVWGEWARPNYKAQEAALARRMAKLPKGGKPDKGGKPAGKPSGKPAGGIPSVDQIFKFMDRDKDGKLSKAEYRGPASAFASIDKDKDGMVTRAEMEAMRSGSKGSGKLVGPKPSAGGNAGLESLFKLADRDGDGKLSKGELRRLVRAGDVDGDETLSLKELLDMQRKPAGRLPALPAKPEPSRKSSKPNAGGKPDKGGRPAGGIPSVEQVFKIMDRDKDGKLTKTEFRGPAHVFTDADKDKDGIVTRAELTELRGRTVPPNQ